MLIIQIILSLVLFAIAIYQILNPKTETESTFNENKYPILLASIVFVLSVCAAFIDSKDKISSDEKTSTTLLKVNEIDNNLIFGIDTLANNLNNISLLNSKLLIITEKTRNVIVEREKQLEDYNKLSESLKKDYAMNFDSYRQLVKKLKFSNSRFIVLIDSLFERNHFFHKEMEINSVRFTFLNERIDLTNKDKIKLLGLEIAKEDELYHLHKENAKKLSKDIESLDVFKKSDKPYDLTRYFEFHVLDNDSK